MRRFQRVSYLPICHYKSNHKIYFLFCIILKTWNSRKTTDAHHATRHAIFSVVYVMPFYLTAVRITGAQKMTKGSSKKTSPYVTDVGTLKIRIFRWVSKPCLQHKREVEDTKKSSHDHRCGKTASASLVVPVDKTGLIKSHLKIRKNTNLGKQDLFANYRSKLHPRSYMHTYIITHTHICTLIHIYALNCSMMHKIRRTKLMLHAGWLLSKSAFH